MGGRPWTAQEIQDLRDLHAQGLLFSQIAAAMTPRTREAVKSMANGLGLTCPDRRGYLERGKALSGRYNKGANHV